jgi:hypothetical protein
MLEYEDYEIKYMKVDAVIENCCILMLLFVLVSHVHYGKREI